MYLIGKGRCPSCGIKGRMWKKSPEIFRCPTCNSFFNEFGMILESRSEKGESFT
jgi:hypothetical protein